MKTYRDFFYSEDISFSDKEERLYAKESLVFDVSEDLLLFLEDHDISKKDLAKRLGKTKAYVTQLLNGSRNMTLGSLSDICFALGFKPEISIPSLEQAESCREREVPWVSYGKTKDDKYWHKAMKKITIKSVVTPDVPQWFKEKKAA